MGAVAVGVEDGEDLDGAAVGADRVRDHARELRGLTRLDQDDPLAELEPRGSGQDREPVPPGMDPQVVLVEGGRRLGDAQLGH